MVGRRGGGTGSNFGPAGGTRFSEDKLMKTDLLKPVIVVIGGNSYPLIYGMAAVIVYQAETARIERSRPHPEEKDPSCLCGKRESQHTGPSRTISVNDQIECWGFRLYVPINGDSLLTPETWKRIDLDLDPERWLACLWAGLHRLSNDGLKSEPPMSLASLAAMIPVGASARALSVKMVEALKYSSSQPPREDASPNAGAPGVTKEGQPEPYAERPKPALSVTLPGSTPVPAAASDLAGLSS
jgi:hypothetical protein